MPAAPRRRWLVLAAFGLLVAWSQVLWLSLAPITTQAHEALGVSEGAVGDLAGLFPLVYVLLAIPTGRWTDRAFTAALSTGALLAAGGAVLRTLGGASYGWILTGQVVLAVAQPLILNSTTKVAARYFPPAERTTAISVAAAAQFVGILVAATTGEPLLRAGGLPVLLAVHAAVTVLASLGVLLAVRVPSPFVVDTTDAPSLGWLRHDPLMWRLAGLLFVGVGIFNATATWLDTLLRGIAGPGDSGRLIAFMTVAGIVGAAVLPGAAGRRDRRRAMLLVATGLTTVVFLAVAVTHSVVLIGCLLAVEGFFLLAGLPVALDWSELHAGPQRAGTATGVLFLAGNLGGAVLVLLVQALIGTPWLALVALAAVAVPGVLLAAGLPDHAPSAEAGPDGRSAPSPRAAR